MSDIFRLVVTFMQGFIDTLNSVTIPYTNQFGNHYNFRIFYFIFALIVLAIIINFFVRGQKDNVNCFIFYSFFWIDSVVGYCFFILLVFGFVYKILRF